VLWKPWTHEYLAALEEWLTVTKKGQNEYLKIGNVVQSCPEGRNQGKRSLGVAVELFTTSQKNLFGEDSPAALRSWNILPWQQTEPARSNPETKLF